MASKRRNMFHKKKTQDMTEIRHPFVKNLYTDDSKLRPADEASIQIETSAHSPEAGTLMLIPLRSWGALALRGDTRPDRYPHISCMICFGAWTPSSAITIRIYGQRERTDLANYKLLLQTYSARGRLCGLLTSEEGSIGGSCGKVKHVARVQVHPTAKNHWDALGTTRWLVGKKVLWDLSDCGDIEVGMKSVVETYQGASRIVRRVLDWKDWILSILDFLAEPHSFIPYVHFEYTIFGDEDWRLVTVQQLSCEWPETCSGSVAVRATKTSRLGQVIEVMTIAPLMSGWTMILRWVLNGGHIAPQETDNGGLRDLSFVDPAGDLSPYCALRLGPP
ncbi:hypothetical protein AAG570_001119 [Ranatra chinensis]|uniref:Uncharacterized protein n=1 Tax=Ranatra chinensis TaxID=642074 RepID=A0ABD0YXE1_9HEMI